MYGPNKSLWMAPRGVATPCAGSSQPLQYRKRNGHSIVSKLQNIKNETRFQTSALTRSPGRKQLCTSTLSISVSRTSCSLRQRQQAAVGTRSAVHMLHLHGCIMNAHPEDAPWTRHHSPDDAGEDCVYGQVADAEDLKRRQARVDARHLQAW
jgi:hypothetical protein